MGLGSRLPWQTKLVAKLVLARLPVPYRFWRTIGLFKHGEMNNPARAIETFEQYYTRAKAQVSLPASFESLELGPGDSILTGLVARANGAQRAWLVDAGDFATTNVAVCQQTVDLLRSQGKIVPDLTQAKSLADVLAQANIEYLTNGTNALARIPDASIDFVWSQVVLEHVPKTEFTRLMHELRRVMKPNAIGVHSIDFRDHLSGGLNNLRFSSRLWESHYFQHSGFYTNRLRPREMLEICRDAGFTVEVTGQTDWPAMPIDRKNLAAEFQPLPDADFTTAEIEILMRPNGFREA